MVVVLPWHNPIRVAEDVVLLDALMGEDRQVFLGVGRGLGRREYGGLGVDQNEARGRFNEGIQIVKSLLRDGECSFDGEYNKLDKVRLRPQPDRDLSRNLYCAGGTEETFAIISDQSVLPLTVPTSSLALSLTNLKKYANVNRERGGEPVRTKLNLWTYICEDPEEAARDVELYYGQYAMTALRHYEMLGSHFGGLKGYESYAKQAAQLSADPDAFARQFREGHPWGTPEQVLARSIEIAHEFGADEIIFVFKFGGMPHEKALRSIKLFAEKVLPGLHAIDPAPIMPWLDDETAAPCEAVAGSR
jgi:alkanesulfonate monooxygenase SsuD/methylene tetrahydromethanopterin reductase-like flavin-dependent oxidoreductase (luciferase family)